MRIKSATRRGAVAALTAVAMVPILGVVALSLEGGMLLDRQRAVHAAADAAALAAAEDLYAAGSCQSQNTTATAIASALSTASANGFSNDGVNSIVTVNIPPQSGINVGQSGYAEVIIQYNQKRSFSGLFGSGALPVKSRAVARGMKKKSTVGILLLNLSVSGALTQNGSATLTVAGSVIINSTSASAVVSVVTGGLIGGLLSVVDEIVSVASVVTANSTSTGGTPTSDFLANVPEPNPTQMNDQGSPGVMTTRSTSLYTPTNGQTLQPGLYIGGIAVNGSASVTLAPGIYYMQGGGFAINGTATVTGSGVMIYNGVSASGTFGSFTTSANCTLVLGPPCGGIYLGISIFQDRTCTNTITLSGGPGWDLTGTVYAAKGHVSVGANVGALSVGSQIVADTMNLSGSANLNLDLSKAYAVRDIRITE